MKKTIKRIALCFAIGSMGLTMGSCDGDDITNILSIVQQLINMNAGTNYVYSGTGSSQSLVKSGEEYQIDGNDSIAAQCQVSVSSNGATANLVLPAITCGNFQMSQVTFNSLALSVKDNLNYLSTGDNTTANGTLTYNGKTYDVSNLYIVCSLNDAQIAISEMSIYFGDDQYALNLTFNGKIVSQ